LSKSRQLIAMQPAKVQVWPPIRMMIMMVLMI
jgi:hypothetical protein